MAVMFCALSSGSKGNSYLIKGEKNTILVDAGLNAKTTAMHLESIGVDPHEIDGIIVTHEHSDHICGIKVLTKKYNIPIYANEKTMAKITSKADTILPQNIRTFTNGEDFFIGEMNITPFKTPHDSVDSCGFSIYCKQNKITVATDLGHMTKTILSNCENSDLLVLEANHDLEMLQNGPYSEKLKSRIQGPHGHISNDMCGKTAAYLLKHGLRQLILAHLSDENNTPDLAYSTVFEYLQNEGAQVGKDVFLDVALQSQRGKCYLLS